MTMYHTAAHSVCQSTQNAPEDINTTNRVKRFILVAQISRGEAKVHFLYQYTVLISHAPNFKSYPYPYAWLIENITL